MVQYLTAQISPTTNTLNRHRTQLVLLPPIQETSTSYETPQIKMASRGNTHMIYRSIPPRPHSYTFTDILDGLPKSSRSKTAPLHTTVPEEYIQRFCSRATAKPKVIDFDGGNVQNSRVTHVSKNGFFPPLRLKLLQTNHKPLELQEPGVQLSRLQLAPLSKKSMKGRRNKQKPLVSSKSNPEVNRSENNLPLKVPLPGSDSPRLKSTHSNVTSTNSVGREEYQALESVDSNIVYPNIMSHSEEFDDLSNFPPPKKIMPNRELPWVYRFKVKKGMNALSKIMASKPTMFGGNDPTTVE
ncbi:hypothetical protein LOTGIDRAFT_238372 [Lottia gigantea]|uniref:Uncharacterized protein n=1 Tax=Lottia gigantea TaxID=225164 RepID=V4AAR9_LOTGI|nr:hypothetical protein LOTGIDRAFT_238372 [Lottia gigantea]ESP01099.1 hypothetical protein LOTGIDRAFT_238372 [Lottia gigantea]